MDQRIKNIRKLPTAELKTYGSAYKKGQVYKFAYLEAQRELKRREQGKTIRKVRKQRSNNLFGSGARELDDLFKW